MAKVVDRLIVGEKSFVSNINRSEEVFNKSRSDIEESIGINNRELVLPFSSLLNVPTQKCTWFSINLNETTFSENIGSSKDYKQTTIFNRINNCVTYGRDANLIEKGTDTTEREVTQKLSSNQTIVLNRTFIPNVGDHILFTSYNINKLYRVNAIENVSFIDKAENFLVTFEESTVFNTVQEIMNNVANEYEFLERNIGSSRRVVMLNTTQKMIDTTKEIYGEINRDYVENFYNEDTDTLHKEMYNTSKNLINYTALYTLQNRSGILKYRNYNDLFITYPYHIDQEENNFKNSIYYNIINRKMTPYSDKLPVYNIESEDYIEKDFEIEYAIQTEMAEEIGYCYTPMYNYAMEVELKYIVNHSFISRFFNMNSIIVGLFDTKKFKFERVKDTGHEFKKIKIKFMNPILLKILDLYHEKEYKEIISFTNAKLKGYTVDNRNIDDYILTPIVLFVINEAIYELSKEDMNITAY